MNAYEAKQEARRERLEAAADRAEARSSAAYKRADMSEAATGIPFGQPIILGSSSEGKHRATIRRADNAMRRCVAEGKRADELRAKAAGVGKAGISSDDPEAVEKLRAKIAGAERSQAFMKAANASVRKARKAGACATEDNAAFQSFCQAIEKVWKDLEIGRPERIRKTCVELLQPDFAGRYGFASYALTNNNANIKRMQARLAQLERARNRESRDTTFDGLKISENTEDNRVQFFFDGKPDADVRAVMKSRGFRWAPSVKAWQRQLTPAGIRGARDAIAELKAMGRI